MITQILCAASNLECAVQIPVYKWLDVSRQSVFQNDIPLETDLLTINTIIRFRITFIWSYICPCDVNGIACQTKSNNHTLTFTSKFSPIHSKYLSKLKLNFNKKNQHDLQPPTFFFIIFMCIKIRVVGKLHRNIVGFDSFQHVLNVREQAEDDWCGINNLGWYDVNATTFFRSKYFKFCLWYSLSSGEHAYI